MAVSMMVDSLAERLYGMTLTTALYNFRCIDCKVDVRTVPMTPADIREWTISAICPECWERLYREMEEAEGLD